MIMNKVGWSLVFLICISVGKSFGQSVNIDCTIEYQRVRGFGGMNMPSWIADLTTDQVKLAFGNGGGQLGLSILRVKVPTDANQFYKEVPAAATAKSLGAIVFATPWSPPASMKTNSSIVGGELSVTSYADYAAHLLSFASYMNSNKASLFAVSLQNEPDYKVTYESCNWRMRQMIDFLKTQGPKFDTLHVIAPESFQFIRTRTDSLLNNSDAVAQFDIVGGHIYGGGLIDYPLARQKGKEVWMTEHFTESNSANNGNTWPLALDVASEIHNCMAANFNAYIWWYIRRFYGLIDESGVATKRGYLMAQYSKFVRPGYIRISSTLNPLSNVVTTAYKSDSSVVVVMVNKSTSAANISFQVNGKTMNTFTRYTTSASKNVLYEGTTVFSGNQFISTIDAQSTTTFVLKNNVANAINTTSSEGIRIFTNPLQQVLTIQLSDSPERKAHGSIVNQLGEVVRHFTVDDQREDLNINDLPEGVYLVKLMVNHREITQKLMKYK